MDKEALEFVRAVLPKGRTIYHHYEDRYAVLLLHNYLKAGPQNVQDLKKSHLASLLRRPLVAEVMSRTGRNWLELGDFDQCWPDTLDAYRLTLDSWPSTEEIPRRSWHQVTRHGYSLVLQLNLPVSHKRELSRSIDDVDRYTSHAYHPVAGAEELTLAWSRIDLELNRGEALVEEIQSDWVRDVKYYAQANWNESDSIWKPYYEDYLKPRAKNWASTMLSATLWFLLQELGIKTIFYHTFETGLKLKQIQYRAPPKSIYSDLPKQFCFRLTHNGPSFLRDSEDRHVRKLFDDPSTTWFVHNLLS